MLAVAADGESTVWAITVQLPKCRAETL